MHTAPCIRLYRTRANGALCTQPKIIYSKKNIKKKKKRNENFSLMLSCTTLLLSFIHFMLSYLRNVPRLMDPTFC